MTWQIWLAIASIIFIVFGLVKRLETRMLLIVAGFILCCASGAPMKAFGAFVKGMTNITLVPAICSAMGFAFAVQASKCDQHLVAAVAAPLKKLGGLLIPAATILTFLINIAIMSAAGTAATAGATFIPLLLRAGIRPAAAAAAIPAGRARMGWPDRHIMAETALPRTKAPSVVMSAIFRMEKLRNRARAMGA